MNDLTIQEAIDICIAIRDKLPFDDNLVFKEMWKEKDAMSILINLATKYVNLKNQKQGDKV